jgi:hypothetical protein
MASAQTWTSAQLLNLAGESPQGAIKKPEVCRAAAGGFHAVYRHHLSSGGVPIKYRRYLGGTLGPVVVAATAPSYAWDEYVCEAGNGDVHVSWENWDDTPNVGWTKSSNGGASFLPFIELTNFPSSAKAPRISPVGPAGSPDVLLVVANPDNADKYIWSNRYNGSAWSGAARTGFKYETEYQVFGIARSPLDGTVYAASNRVSGTLTLLTYNGQWTSSDIAAPGFYARQSVAANEAGQIMYCWEKDSAWYSRLYSPGAGWGAAQYIDSGGSGSVVYVPGTLGFYTAYAHGNPGGIRGRLFSQGAWGAAETISVGLAGAQSLDARVAVATDGSMLCCWEYWGNGNAEAWYAVRSAPPPGPTGTLAGTVRDQYGAGVPNVAVTTVMSAAVTGPTGAYSVACPAGTYTVLASKSFYGGQSVPNVVVQAGQTTTVNPTITGQAPAAVSGLAVASASRTNTVSWTNPASPPLTGTRIVFRTDRAPTGPADGTLLTDDAAAPGSLRSAVQGALTNGVTHYYGAYAYFQDASRFYSPGAVASGTPAVGPDMDRDADVDQSDFGLFQACYSGAFAVQNDPACAEARLDADNDVDGDDLAIFAGCVSGPGAYANPACSD